MSLFDVKTESMKKVIDSVISKKLDELGYEQKWIMRLGAKRNHCSIRGRKHIEALDVYYNPQTDIRPPFAILDYESCNSQFLKCRKFDIIVDTIKKLGCSGSYLDIGCETGALVQRLSDRFEKLNGVDVNIKAIEYAKTKNLENASFKINDGTNLEFSDKSFNCVSCLDAIEHITEPELLVSEVYRVLEDNGTFIMSVPNWFDAARRFLTKIKTKHVNSYTPFGWKRMLKNKGFKVIEFRAADFPIFSYEFLAKHLSWLGMCIIIVARKRKVNEKITQENI